jgi:hypothetical protein
MYAVSLHPSGGIRFAGTDLNGKPFSLRLDPALAADAGDEMEARGLQLMRQHAFVDARPQIDTISEGIEKT